MEETLPKKAFDKVAYAREYQRKRYHSDDVFKQRQIDHVKKLYKHNQDLLKQNFLKGNLLYQHTNIPINSIQDFLELNLTEKRINSLLQIFFLNNLFKVYNIKKIEKYTLIF